MAILDQLKKHRKKAKILKRSMEIQEIKSILGNRKGQNVKAIWGKTMKTRKGITHIVEKLTSLVVRAGIDYDNMGLVQEKREAGELPAENAGLPWGQWAEFPFHIEHKGTDYARFYPASGLEFTPKVEYYLDGLQVEKSAIVEFCLASEFPKAGEEKPLCFTVKAENVKAILI